MLYIRLIWLKWRHLYNGMLIYFKNIFHFLTFQTSKLPKRPAKNTKNMTSFPCFVRPDEKCHPYMWTSEGKCMLKIRPHVTNLVVYQVCKYGDTNYGRVVCYEMTMLATHSSFLAKSFFNKKNTKNPSAFLKKKVINKKLVNISISKTWPLTLKHCVKTRDVQSERLFDQKNARQGSKADSSLAFRLLTKRYLISIFSLFCMSCVLACVGFGHSECRNTHGAIQSKHSFV